MYILCLDTTAFHLLLSFSYLLFFSFLPFLLPYLLPSFTPFHPFFLSPFLSFCFLCLLSSTISLSLSVSLSFCPSLCLDSVSLSFCSSLCLSLPDPGSPLGGALLAVIGNTYIDRAQSEISALSSYSVSLRQTGTRYFPKKYIFTHTIAKIIEIFFLDSNFFFHFIIINLLIALITLQQFYLLAISKILTLLHDCKIRRHSNPFSEPYLFSITIVASVRNNLLIY